MRKAACMIAYQELAMFAVALAIATSTNAATLANPLSSAVTGATVFENACLAEGPILDHLADLARAAGWKPLAEDLVVAFTPNENTAAAKGWVISDDPFVAVASSMNLIAGRAVEACTVAAANEDVGLFEKQIVAKTTGTLQDTIQSGGTIVKRFSAADGPEKQELILTLPINLMGKGEVTASITRNQRMEN